MVKKQTVFTCQKCGWESPKWEGRCRECGAWNSLVEETRTKSTSKRSSISGESRLFKISEVKTKKFKRISSGIEELDRVLGGGIVPGSVILSAGSPGIGKSTLLTQLALELVRSKKTTNSIVYICGEESPEQIKIRIKRLFSKTLKLTNSNDLFFLPETNIEKILLTIRDQQPAIDLMIVDSIQTLWSEKLTGIPGSVGQVRECANQLHNFAKRADIPIFIIGHVTKQGSIAGPKVLEHLVDTVLFLEGDKKHDFRVLRAVKNRFGPTDEVGIFKMGDRGLEEVNDPSQIFLSEGVKKEPGRAVAVVLQGVRPMLVEIQALVVPSKLAVPRRVASGFSFKRLQVLCAVLQKKLGLPLANSDVFVSSIGGLNVKDPGADLAVAMAVYSSLKNRALSGRTVCIGEVGLLGDIKKVPFFDKRVKQAEKMGYKRVIGAEEKTLTAVIKLLRKTTP